MLKDRVKVEASKWSFSKKRLLNLAIGLTALLLTELARTFYRPFIYENGINDFHIADTLGNSLGTVATVFVFVGLLGRDRLEDLFLIRTVTISVFVYELAHPLLGKPIDPFDMVATVLAGFFCEGLYRLLYKSEQPVPKQSGDNAQSAE